MHVVCSDEELLSLSTIAAPLLQRKGSMLDPRFFAASVEKGAWIPRIVVVRTPERLSGLVYFKERKISRFGTGILYGDATLHSMVLAEETEGKRILSVALRTVLERRGVWALRILVPPNGYELDAFEEARASIPADLKYVEAENHCTLALPRDYESFLCGLGSRTRRNFRYYRRRFEEAGHRYVPRMTAKEFTGAADELEEKAVVGADQDGLRRGLKVLSVVDRPMLAGLQHRDGRWLSIIGGWYEDHSSMIFLQMNDDLEHASSSLSAVMRAYLIEDLIAAGYTALQFWAGVGGPLGRKSEPVPSLKVFVDKRGFFCSSIRSLVKSSVPLFPHRMKWAADWIACPDRHP